MASTTPKLYQNTRSGMSVALAGFMSIMVPAALTLGSVKYPGTLSIPTDNPSPYGYTISLLMFFIPSALLLLWLSTHPEAKTERQAFYTTIFCVFGTGCVLDFFFAYMFFYYTNVGATINVRLPAWSFQDWHWHMNALPIEEFGFYAGGAFFMTALYVWADLKWFPRPANNVIRRQLAEKYTGKKWWQILKFDWRVMLIGVVVCLVAVAARKALVPEPGFPGYFILLVMMAFVPTIMMFEIIEPILNWQAFTLMFTVLQLVSLMWEATLGVPYNWWNYHHNQMVGIFIGAWAQLPLESVIMWVAGGWATTILYEWWRLYFTIAAEPTPKPDAPTAVAASSDSTTST